MGYLRVLELRKQFTLINDRIDGLFVDDSHFRHLFHRIHGLELLALYFPHSTKTSLADNTMELEVLLRDG